MGVEVGVGTVSRSLLALEVGVDWSTLHLGARRGCRLGKNWKESFRSYLYRALLTCSALGEQTLLAHLQEQAAHPLLGELSSPRFTLRFWVAFLGWKYGTFDQEVCGPTLPGTLSAQE